MKIVDLYVSRGVLHEIFIVESERQMVEYFFIQLSCIIDVVEKESILAQRLDQNGTGDTPAGVRTKSFY